MPSLRVYSGQRSNVSRNEAHGNSRETNAQSKMRTAMLISVIWGCAAVFAVVYSAILARQALMATDSGQSCTFQQANCLRGQGCYQFHSVFSDHDLQNEASSAKQESLAYILCSVVGGRRVAFLLINTAADSALRTIVCLMLFDKFLQELILPQEASLKMQRLTAMIIALLYAIPVASNITAMIASSIDARDTGRVVAELSSLVFEKALRMKEHEECGWDLKSMKPNKIQLLQAEILEAWSATLSAVAYAVAALPLGGMLCWMLYQRLALQGLKGCLCILFALLVTFLLQRAAMHCWNGYKENQEKRLECVIETVQNLRMIKALGWERIATNRMNKARLEEIDNLFFTGAVQALEVANRHTAPVVAVLIAVLPLPAEIVKPEEILYARFLAMFLLSQWNAILLGVQKCRAVWTNFLKVKAFLASTSDRKLPVPSKGMAARLQGTFSFKDGKTACLHDLNLEFPSGQLTAVTGPSGAGKSAVLQALLGELRPTSPGCVMEVCDSILSCSQHPWVFRGTLQENVVLGREVDQACYHEALRCAALPQDSALPGETPQVLRAARTLGNQRSRIGLARAAYNNSAEIVLLDQPLSALDSTTAEYIFDELIVGPALQKKTRIVVMDADMNLLKRFDRIIVMEAGRVSADGPPEQILRGVAFSQLQNGKLLPETLRDIPPERRWAPPERGAGLDEEPKIKEVLEIWVFHICRNVVLILLLLYLVWMFFVGEQAIMELWIDFPGGQNATYPSATAMTWGDFTLTNTNYEEGRQRLAATVTGTALSTIVVTVSFVQLWENVWKNMHKEAIARLMGSRAEGFLQWRSLSEHVNHLVVDLQQVDVNGSFSWRALASLFVGAVITNTYIMANLSWTLVFVALPAVAILFLFLVVQAGHDVAEDLGKK